MILFNHKLIQGNGLNKVMGECSGNICAGIFLQFLLQKNFKQMNNTFLLYGANGYTGELIARHAIEMGLKPILAGRNREAITQLADELQLSHLIFSLDETEKLEQALSEAPWSYMLPALLFIQHDL